MTILAATAAAEPNAGWGKLLGLLTAIALFTLGTTVHKRWLAVKDEPLSPPGEGVALDGVKPQVGAGSDPVLTPSKSVATREEPDLDEFVRRNVGRMRRADIIRTAKARFRRSESTVKRAIRRAKDTTP